MAFDANRDIRIDASEGAPGRYTLRTRGLAARRRPELEIAGVPEAGLNAAGGVINILAEYSVNKAEIAAGQSVGNVLTVGENGRQLLLAVRAISLEKPKGGLWSKIAGGAKGVLRIVDADSRPSEAGPPLTALATMLVHRAAVRLAKSDRGGARTELEAAIAVFPGERGTGAAPSIDGADGALNWQNHLAYLDLATLARGTGDVEEAATFFGAAVSRSEELARRELGATFDPLASWDDAVIEREAKRIIDHNLAAVHLGSEASSTLVALASPVWELVEPSVDAVAARRASRVPRALVALYYEGAAAAGLRRAGPALAARILAASRDEPWRAAWTAREARNAWIHYDESFLETVGPAHPAHGVVSSVLADVARCFRAGATDDEILTRYGAVTVRASARESLEDKLGRLCVWESEQYATVD